MILTTHKLLKIKALCLCASVADTLLWTLSVHCSNRLDSQLVPIFFIYPFAQLSGIGSLLIAFIY